MSNLNNFLIHKTLPKVKVGDMVGFPAENPKIFAICTRVTKNSSGYLVVEGKWCNNKIVAELANIGHICLPRTHYRLRDVIIITDYVKKPFPECINCLGCEKVKQPSDCRFNCPQKDKMIKTLLEIK
jgi:hypothetical protein